MYKGTRFEVVNGGKWKITGRCPEGDCEVIRLDRNGKSFSVKRQSLRHCIQHIRLYSEVQLKVMETRGMLWIA